jgi:hypothetical protein
MSSSLSIAVIQRLLAIQPNVVKEVFNGRLPIHNAVKSRDLVVMEFLLDLYPESAKVITGDELFPDFGSDNLLHLAVKSHDGFKKVTHLVSRYPELLYQRNGSGKTPLHLALGNHADISTAKLLCEIGGSELVRAPVIHPTKQTGWLPLHVMIDRIDSFDASPYHVVIELFRMILQLYPEAAGIAVVVAGSKRFLYSDSEPEEEGIAVVEAGDLKTPYQLAVDRKLSPYFLRLLLRAAPDLDPAELHRLNWTERRMAMFMAFRAITTKPTPLLLARLRFENKDLVKHVVSFL